MTASSKDKPGLLVVTSFCDRPEGEIFKRLAESLRITMICDPGNPGQGQLREAGIEIVPCLEQKRSNAKLTELIGRSVADRAINCVYAPRTQTLAACLKTLRQSNVKIVGYRGTTGHLSIMDIGPRLTYTDRRIDRIICVSDAVRTYLMSKGIASGSLVTIPKGHDIGWYEPAPRKALQDLGIPGDAFVIGFSGRARRIKGVGYLVGALSRIPPEMNAHLLLVGEMDDQIVKAMLRSPTVSERVHCTGFREDAPALIGACDAFVMPSLKREGLPRALVEAMAQGVPSVASRVGGIPELIEDQVSGILVPPRKPSAIAEALTLIASDKKKAEKIGVKAKERIERDFNVETTVAKMLRVFTD
jgi:glycosyltransferase involved in cell wall biosynthesis